MMIIKRTIMIIKVSNIIMFGIFMIIIKPMIINYKPFINLKMANKMLIEIG